MNENLSTMGISEIASLISKDWRPVNYAAQPYLTAMFSLESIDDKYGVESGRSIVAYFLTNASQWKGETAKAVKTELKKRLKSRKSSIANLKIAAALLKLADEMLKSEKGEKYTPELKKQAIEAITVIAGKLLDWYLSTVAKDGFPPENEQLFKNTLFKVFIEWFHHTAQRFPQLLPGEKYEDTAKALFMLYGRGGGVHPFYGSYQKNANALNDNHIKTLVDIATKKVLTKDKMKQPVVAKEIPDAILREFRHLSNCLSPENLCEDGELSHEQSEQKQKKLMSEWRQLEEKVGRKVTDDEIWAPKKG